MKTQRLTIIFAAIFVAVSLGAIAFAMSEPPVSERGALASVSARDIDIYVSDFAPDTEQDLAEQMQSELTVEPAPIVEPEPVPMFDEQTIARARELLDTMTDEEKLYQLFFVTPESLTGYGTVVEAGNVTRTALGRFPVGGLIYATKNMQTQEQVSRMLSATQEYTKIPLFLGVEEEGGRVASVSGSATMGFDAIAPMAELGATGNALAAYESGSQIGHMLAQLGFNMNFAPVADVLINPDNAELGDRAFSSDAATAATMSSAVLTGLRDAGIAGALKHFPGFGGAMTGGQSESLRTQDQMRAEEFLPFVAGIESAADFVLVSHMMAPELDPSGVPSALSYTIVTELLRKELGFEKIIITDSLSDSALANANSGGEAAVLAIEAGADMVLAPRNLTQAVSALESAVSSGRISSERIDESVMRILSVKLERGIIE